MGFMTFPTHLTEEEKLLQHKYQKLKRKRKQIQELKNPKTEVVPTPPVIIPSVKRVSLTDKDTPKADAKEVAKKLLKSGAIAAIKVPEKKDAGFVRKRTVSDRVGDRPGGYKPFSHSTSVDGSDSDDVFSGNPSDPNPAPEYSAKYGYRSGQGSYVSPKDAEVIAREETIRERKREGKAHYVNRDVPNHGNTVYIRGSGLTESSIRRTFSVHGTIGAIAVETEKNCAFVTFETIEEANRAIDSVNGSTIDGVEVHVSLARKQLRMANNGSSSSSSTLSSSTSSISSPQPSPSVSSGNVSWGSMAANYFKEEKDSPKKDSSKFKRTRFVYDDEPPEY